MADVRERARRERIRVLLRTRNDCYPTPRARATPYTTSGPGEGRKRQCPACEGTGKTRLRQKCPSCDGERTIKVDSYVGRVSSERHTTHQTPQVIDSEIQRLKGYRIVEAGDVDPNEAYGWEKARAHQLRTGSYQALERALERLRELDPMGWDFLMWVYGPLNPELDRYRRLDEDRMVGKLSRLMPGQIRIPRREHERIKQERTDQARDLAKKGKSLEEIVELTLLPMRVLLEVLRKAA